MSFTKLKPPLQGATGAGINLSISVPKNGQAKVRLSIAAWMQDKIFGGPIDGSRFDILVGSGAQEGLMILRKTPDGEFEARVGVKDSVSFWIEHWDLLPRSPRKATPCNSLGLENGEWTIKLPEWSRPKGRGGKIGPSASDPQTSLGR